MLLKITFIQIQLEILRILPNSSPETDLVNNMVSLTFSSGSQIIYSKGTPIKKISVQTINLGNNIGGCVKYKN